MCCGQTLLIVRMRLDCYFWFQQCMGLLEEGGREALGDVVTRVLRRAAADGRDEELDCTLVT